MSDQKDRLDQLAEAGGYSIVPTAYLATLMPRDQGTPPDTDLPPDVDPPDTDPPTPPDEVGPPPIVGNVERRSLAFVYVQSNKRKGLDVPLNLVLVRKPGEWSIVANTYEGKDWDEPLDKAVIKLDSLPKSMKISGVVGNGKLVITTETREGGEMKTYPVARVKLPSGGFRGDLAANATGQLPEHPPLWDSASLKIRIGEWVGTTSGNLKLDVSGGVPEGTKQITVHAHLIASNR